MCPCAKVCVASPQIDVAGADYDKNRFCARKDIAPINPFGTVDAKMTVYN